MKQCPKCGRRYRNARGMVQVVPQAIRGGGAVKCPECGDTEVVLSFPCPHCGKFTFFCNICQEVL